MGSLARHRRPCEIHRACGSDRGCDRQRRSARRAATKPRDAMAHVGPRCVRADRDASRGRHSYALRPHRRWRGAVHLEGHARIALGCVAAAWRVGDRHRLRADSRRWTRGVRHRRGDGLSQVAGPAGLILARLDRHRLTCRRGAHPGRHHDRRRRARRVRAGGRRHAASPLAGQAVRPVARLGTSGRSGGGLLGQQVGRGRPGGFRGRARRRHPVPLPAEALPRVERLGRIWKALPAGSPDRRVTKRGSRRSRSISPATSDTSGATDLDVPWTDWISLDYEASPLRLPSR